MTCPKCGSECERDEVDNGVGMEACGPWGCPECHWVEKRPAFADDEPSPSPGGTLMIDHAIADRDARPWRYYKFEWPDAQAWLDKLHTEARQLREERDELQSDFSSFQEHHRATEQSLATLRERIGQLPRYQEADVVSRPSTNEYLNAEDVDDLLADSPASQVPPAPHAPKEA